MVIFVGFSIFSLSFFKRRPNIDLKQTACKTRTWKKKKKKIQNYVIWKELSNVGLSFIHFCLSLSKIIEFNCLYFFSISAMSLKFHPYNQILYFFLKGSTKMFWICLSSPGHFKFFSKQIFFRPFHISFTMILSHNCFNLGWFMLIKYL